MMSDQKEAVKKRIYPFIDPNDRICTDRIHLFLKDLMFPKSQRNANVSVIERWRPDIVLLSETNIQTKRCDHL